MEERKEGLTKEQKVLLGLGIAGAVAASFKLGGAWEAIRFKTGLDKLFEVDPDLENQIWDAINLVQKNKK